MSHQQSRQPGPSCGVLQNAIVGPRVIRGTRRILTASLRIGHDRPSLAAGRGTNVQWLWCKRLCGGKGVSVTHTDGDTHLQRLSFSRTRSLSVVPTPVCGRARHCRPQQLRRVQSSSRGLERRRIHLTLSPHTTSNRPAERSSTANLPIRPVDVVPFLARHHTWPSAMTTGRRDYQSLNPATNNLCHRDGKMSKVILPLLKGRNMLFSSNLVSGGPRCCWRTTRTVHRGGRRDVCCEQEQWETEVKKRPSNPKKSQEAPHSRAATL